MIHTTEDLLASEGVREEEGGKREIHWKIMNIEEEIESLHNLVCAMWP